MGHLVDGEWRTEWYAPDEKGRFRRPQTRFRRWIRADGSTEYTPVAGRYHVYASYACPWAHRVLITRALRGLEQAVSVTIVDPHMGDDGWPFADDAPDPLGPSRFLRDVYLRAQPDYTGRVTVPVLWDREGATIVSNESREIMRMLDVELASLATRSLPGDSGSLCPPALQAVIDETLDAIYEPINNGVYRAGFATTQGAYEDAVRELFDALEHWEGVLAGQRFLCGDVLTEADVALFTTLLRFDVVYHGHFKCNLRRIQDSPVLWGYLRDVYQTPGVRETCRLDHIKTHYYWSQTTVNPTRIVPLGPTLDLDAPHHRDRLAAG
jgi:glutathionyl-hydroquinone reductase